MGFWVNAIDRKEKILKIYDSFLAQVRHILRKNICKGLEKRFGNKPGNISI